MTYRLWLGMEAQAQIAKTLMTGVQKNRRGGSRRSLDEAGWWGPATLLTRWGWRGDFSLMIDTGIAWQDPRVDVYRIIFIKAEVRMCFKENGVRQYQSWWLVTRLVPREPLCPKLTCARVSRLVYSASASWALAAKQSELDKYRPIKKLDDTKEVKS